jgi:Zn-finger protein
MATAWSGATLPQAGFNAVSRPSTSAHGSGAGLTWTLGVSGTVWGSGANNTANGSMILECTSCHNPHGTAGFTNATASTTMCNTALLPGDPCTKKIASYRLLRWQPQGSGGFTATPATNVNWSGGAFPLSGTVTGWTVPDNFAVIGTEWYTIGTVGAFAAGDYNAGNANNTYNLKNAAAAEVNTNIPAAVNEPYFCAQCHDRYLNNSRLRNATDASVYCGNPLNATTALGGNATLFYSYLPDADGIAPYIHPVDPVRCLPVVSATTGLITGWGDNGDSGDTTYMFRHTSGDIRITMDQSSAAGAGTSVSRSCAACHVAHGTSAAMTILASDATLTAVAGPDVNNSVLLRMDNRSLCLRCHAGNVNFTVAP